MFGSLVLSISLLTGLSLPFMNNMWPTIADFGGLDSISRIYVPNVLEGCHWFQTVLLPKFSGLMTEHADTVLSRSAAQRTRLR